MGTESRNDYRLPLYECDTLGHLSYAVGDTVGHDGVC